MVVDCTIALLTIAFLLVTALVGHKAQDLSSSVGGGNQARRVLVAPDVSMSADAKRDALARGKKVEEAGSTPFLMPDDDMMPTEPNPNLADVPEVGRVTLSAVSGSSEPARGATSGSPEATIIPTSSGEPSFRQTRATTKKHSESPSSTESSTSTSSTAARPATEEEDDEEDESGGKTPPPSKKKIRRRKKKKPTSTSSTTESDKVATDEDPEQADSEAEEDPKDRLPDKKARHHYKNATAAASGNQGGITERGPKLPDAGSTTQASASKVPASSTKKSAAGSKSRPTGAATVLPVGPPLQRNPSVTSSTKQPADSSLDHEYYDDDESVKTSSEPKLPVDYSKVKLVGLDKFNESVAQNHSILHSSTSKPEPSSSSAVTTSLNPIETSLNSHGTSEGLDSRSPSGQATVGGFAKRLTTILADSRNKLMPRPTTVPPPTSPSSSTNTRFAYSKPYSSTTMMTPVTQRANLTAEGMFVQILDPSESGGSVKSDVSSQNNTRGDNLDWSKLVKVVFKSARDNHTVYTVVMNSSELSNHPINDWSNELPRLFQDDFEKLIQKWSNVFPFDHLMIDLGKIIIDKVTATPSTNRSLSKSPILAKLNETIPSNGTTRLGASDSVIRPLSKVTGAILSPGNATNPSNATQASVLPGQSKTSADNLKPNSPNTSNQQAHNQNHTHLLDLVHSKNDMQHRNNSSLPSITFETNSSMLSASPKGLRNISMDYIKTTLPWSSSRDLSNLGRDNSSASGVGKINRPFVSVGSTASGAPTASDNSPGGQQNYTNKDDLEAHHIIGMMKDMTEEHTKLGNDVKEQAGSLRHFIIVCSVAVVVATSLIMVLIVKLLK